MERSQRQSHRRGLSRRQVLKAGAATGVGLFLPRAAVGATPARQSATPSTISGTFRAMSWESEAEMRKWRLHIDRFFQTYYPNMTPQIDYGISWDEYWTKLQTTIAGGAQLDMCWMHDSRAKSYAELGMIVPLDDYIAAEPPDGWPDQFYQSQVEAFQYEGKQYGIPYDWATGGFYVNLDVLERAGVEVPTADWTFDDLLNAGLKIKQTAPDPSQQWGFYLPTESGGTNWIVRSFGGKQITPDPLTSHFDDPNTIAAYQYLYDAIWKHEIMPTPDALQALGLAEEVAFASGRIGIAYSLNDAAFVFDEVVGDQARWTMAPTPRGKDGRFQFVGGSAFSVAKTASFPEIAYQCARYTATDPQNLPITAKMGSMFVSRKDAWQNALPSPDQADPDVYKYVFYDLGARDAALPLYFPGYQQWDSTIYTKNIQQLWAGATDDVAGVLKRVHEETQRFFESRGS